ncbi:Nudix (Nucleoside diphosphate linked moiety X)-type motif 1 [Rhizoctonia solani]
MHIPGIPPLPSLDITSEGSQQGYEAWRQVTALKILLGLKKRGFGIGIYNGFGGKVDVGETVADAALRELQYSELTHGKANPQNEMRPEWFAYPSLEIPSTSVSSGNNTYPPFPYSAMWKDDPLWIPHLLTDKYFVARVDYGPVPVPSPGQTVEPVSDGTGYIVDGTTVDAGMQKWIVGTMSKEEWEASRVWEV